MDEPLLKDGPLRRHVMAACARFEHVVGLGLLLLLAACGSAQTDAAAELAFEVLDADARSAVGEARTVVIRDAEAWTRLWAEHKAHRIPAPPAPAVDFERRMVLGVFLGHRPNGCYGVEILAVRRTPRGVVVGYRERRPGDRVCSQALTAPSQLVALPRVAAAVSFQAK